MAESSPNAVRVEQSFSGLKIKEVMRSTCGILHEDPAIGNVTISGQ